MHIDLHNDIAAVKPHAVYNNYTVYICMCLERTKSDCVNLYKKCN